jgi:hypothetical protein
LRIFAESSATRASMLHKFQFEERQLQLLVTGDEELVPYREQGNPTYDEPSPVRKRKGLLNTGAAQLAAVAKLYWDAGRLQKNASMPRDKYLVIHRLLCKALAPDLSERAARRAAEADWRHDSSEQESAATSLSFGGYTSSLFDLADQWTDSLDLDDYLHFLQVRDTRPHARAGSPRTTTRACVPIVARARLRADAVTSAESAGAQKMQALKRARARERG